MAKAPIGLQLSRASCSNVDQDRAGLWSLTVRAGSRPTRRVLEVELTNNELANLLSTREATGTGDWRGLRELVVQLYGAGE